MRESLMASMGPIELSDLRAHLVRDAVIVVGESLDLLDVAEALAKDDKTRVSAWIESGALGKPSLEAIDRWSKPGAVKLTSVVVRPFVLVQESKSESN